MTLLFIDDDPEDLELFQEATKIIDSTSLCMSANNGKDGLTILNTILPDCIFLDINMPVMNGLETLKNIRKNKRFQEIPIFILSTSKDKYEAQVCRALGAKEFLIKPDSFRELVTELRSAIEMGLKTV